ncbi:MAG: hypothetical protein ISR85_06595 [Kiritimatiellales bacterium]|nr:hypothetical protein [Kiritimatiellota bacterium]MBL7012578.1 hypothetical protein [Kiritimatiellales bacterium]
MSLRRELSQAVQTRLKAGESKIDIYNALKERFSAASVERALAQWPLPEACEKNRYLNYPLMIIVIVFTLVNALRLAPAFQTPGPYTARAVLIVIIHIYTIYGIKNFNLIGYLLALLLGISTVLSIGTVGPGTVLPLALAAAAIVLSFMQKTRLFPNTPWILRHKKDENGQPVF